MSIPVIAGEMPPEQVIGWLRSEDGEHWLKRRVTVLYRPQPHHPHAL
jgi:hypothetical protein